MLKKTCQIMSAGNFVIIEQDAMKLIAYLILYKIAHTEQG